MDSILFYGDRDENARRQVRSAAASHSHRIGPRKPKISKRPRADSNNTKKRNGKMTASSPVQPATVIEAALNATVFNAASSPGTSQTNVQKSTARPDSASPTAGSSPSNTSSQTPPTNLEVTERDKELKRQAAHARWHQLQAMQQIQPPPSSPNGVPTIVTTSPPIETPPTLVYSPPSLEHLEQLSSSQSHLSSNPHVSPAPASIRLPQYSWTEYPRYGVHTKPSTPQTTNTFRPYGMAPLPTPRSQPQSHSPAYG